MSLSETLSPFGSREGRAASAISGRLGRTGNFPVAPQFPGGAVIADGHGRGNDMLSRYAPAVSPRLSPLSAAAAPPTVRRGLLPIAWAFTGGTAVGLCGIGISLFDPSGFPEVLAVVGFAVALAALVAGKVVSGRGIGGST